MSIRLTLAWVAALIPAMSHACPPFQYSEAAASALHAVQKSAGLSGTNFEIRASERVLNAKALICDGSRYVLVNEQFLSDLGWTNEHWNWRDVGILAREIGRHVMGHVVYRGERHREELSADRYAGEVLFRLGASLNQALAMIDVLPEEMSSSHPKKSERAAAVSEGWSRAGAATDRPGGPTPR